MSGWRVSRAAAEAAVRGMTEDARTAGILAPDAEFVIYGAYGAWALRGTGGYLGTGQTEITHLRTLREVAETAWAFSRAVSWGMRTVEDGQTLTDDTRRNG